MTHLSPGITQSFLPYGQISRKKRVGLPALSLSPVGSLAPPLRQNRFPPQAPLSTDLDSQEHLTTASHAFLSWYPLTVFPAQPDLLVLRAPALNLETLAFLSLPSFRGSLIQGGVLISVQTPVTSRRYWLIAVYIWMSHRSICSSIHSISTDYMLGNT